MKLKPEDLDAQLARRLAPVYLIAGDEPLLVQEGADAVRACARAQGYADREVFNVDAGFDWNALLQSAASLSLFADRRIIELRMPGGKPGDAGSKALVQYAAAPPDDALLLVLCGKLDTSARNSKWYNALADAGAAVQVWPIDARMLPGWITRRMRAKGMQASREAVSLLAERVENNLLAAAQEIEKLLLLHGPGNVDVDAVAEAVGDNARFDVFKLVDEALAGAAGRALRMLASLRAEGVEPVIIVWALAREVRLLAGFAHAVARGQPAAAVLAAHHVWDKRKAAVSAALARHAPPQWQRLVSACARADRVSKGMEAGAVWEELVDLVSALAGVDLSRPARRPPPGGTRRAERPPA